MKAGSQALSTRLCRRRCWFLFLQFRAGRHHCRTSRSARRAIGGCILWLSSRTRCQMLLWKWRPTPGGRWTLWESW